MALAAIVALTATLAAGCGSSHRGSAGSQGRSIPARAAGAPAGAAVVTTPTFRTVLPAGWRSDLAGARARGYALLAATAGPRYDGVGTQIVVSRVRARWLRAGGLRRTLRAGIRRNRAKIAAGPRSVTVAGAPAVAADTMREDGGRRLAVRTVDILHGGWLYIVTAVAADGHQAGGVHALALELARWRWR